MKIFETFKRQLQVVRKTPGTWSGNGLFVEGDPEFITIKASADPTPAEVMLTLPEGYRTKDSYTLFTDTELRTAKKNETNADVVFINDEKYQVVRVAHWNNTILRYYEVIVIKEDSDDAN